VVQLLSAAVLAAGCAAWSESGQRVPARPPPGGEAEVVFDQIAAIRRDDGATPPGWVERLAPLARDAAVAVAGGEPPRVVATHIGERAVHEFGHDVMTYWQCADSLQGLAFDPTLVRRHDLIAAIAVAPVRAGCGSRRYAIVIVAPDAGMGPQPSM
jgi:hypothetical protein